MALPISFFFIPRKDVGKLFCTPAVTFGNELFLDLEERHFFTSNTYSRSLPVTCETARLCWHIIPSDEYTLQVQTNMFLFFFCGFTINGSGSDSLMTARMFRSFDGTVVIDFPSLRRA